MPLQVLREDGSAQGTEDFTEPMAVLRGRVEAIQRAQVALMRPLLFYPPSVAESLSTVATHRSSKTAFHAFVIFLVQKNVGVLRQVPPPGTSHNSTLVNLFFVVLWFLGPAVQIQAFGRPPSRAASSPRAESPTHRVSGGCSGSADGDLDQGGAPRNGAAAAAERLEIQACGAEPADAGLQPRSPIAAVEPPDLTAIATARNGATAPTVSRSPRRNGSKKSRKSCSKELDGPDCSGQSCGGTPRSRRASASASTFWNFPAGEFFLQQDAGSEPYLELNRVGGILSEAAKNRPEASEPLSIDASDVAVVLRNSGAPTCPPAESNAEIEIAWSGTFARDYGDHLSTADGTNWRHV